MNKKLSGRLMAMAGFVSAGESIADIGSDHAYLPRYLIENGIARRAILTDVKEGPLAMAKGSVARERGEGDERYEFRLGDGLEPLVPGEVDSVIIAGMGGETIVKILSADIGKSASFEKFILQPRTKAEVLKEWLKGAGWSILEALFAEEKGRMCEVLAVSPRHSV